MRFDTQKLSAICKERNISGHTMNKVVSGGVRCGVYYSWISGKTKPSLIGAYRAAKFLGMRIEDFIIEEERAD